MIRGRSILSAVARGGLLLAVAALLLFAAVLAIDSVSPPTSTLMLARLVQGKPYARDYVALSDIAPVAVASVIASEDATFCRNGGVDWGALREVIDEAGEDGPSRGASTLTMQTARNLFLWQGRSNIRKGLEIAIALLLGHVWSKQRVVEVYLNIAEWGDGVFGIEAAAQRAFHKSARLLDAREAALLATSLPSPLKRDAAHPLLFQRRLATNLEARARANADGLGCLRR